MPAPGSGPRVVEAVRPDVEEHQIQAAEQIDELEIVKGQAGTLVTQVNCGRAAKLCDGLEGVRHGHTPLN